MQRDTRTEAERCYDATALSWPRSDPWAPIVETMLDNVHPAVQPTFNPATYDYDKCIAVVERLEAAVGIPQSNDDDFDVRTLDKETADALDIFFSWWNRARRAGRSVVAIADARDASAGVAARVNR